MTPIETIGGGALVAALLGLSGYFGRQELRKLGCLRNDTTLESEDLQFIRSKARRRLVCCALMVVFAGLLVGAFLLEWPLQEVLGQGLDGNGKFNQEQKNFLRFYGGYWIAALLVLLGILAAAALDLWAIRRYSIRTQHKLHAERREMIREELASLRRQRAERN